MIKEFDLHYRDWRTSLFLPNQVSHRTNLLDQRHKEITEALLGMENPDRQIGVLFEETPEENPTPYLEYKEREFHNVIHRYRKIFDLCRVLGITNIYDIGCCTINQSFLLAHHSRINYTGIDDGFILNDWRTSDLETNNYYRLLAPESPPPFCNGRIRFVKGCYPDASFEVKPNNIAIGSYSLTMCEGKECIEKTVSALTHDFERILFNLPPRDTDAAFWKGADWAGFEIHPIGPFEFVLATKNPCDLHRMKEMYPCDEKGRFDTGIDDSIYGMFIPNAPYEFYADWLKELD